MYIKLQADCEKKKQLIIEQTHYRNANTNHDVTIPIAEDAYCFRHNTITVLTSHLSFKTTNWSQLNWLVVQVVLEESLSYKDVKIFGVEKIASRLLHFSAFFYVKLVE